MPLSEAQRKQISELWSNGTSIAGICRRFKCSRETARLWARRGQQHNRTFADAPRSGRPKSLQQSQRSKARRMARGGRSVPHITKTINKQRQQPVSKGSVRRALKDSKSPLRWVPLTRGRQLSPVNIEKRLVFCNKHLRSQCKAWLYGDSKFYYMYKDQAGNVRWRWCNAEDQQQVLKAGSPTVLHFYGFVGKAFKSPLYFVPPTPPASSKARKGRSAFASKHFIGMLSKIKQQLQQAGKFGPRRPIVLDHARQHTSRTSKAAIARLQLPLVEDFPPQSWDLNIIENVWGVLDGKLSAMGGRPPTTSYGWRRRVTRAWDAIDQATINKLVDAVPNRVAGVAEQQGQWLCKKGMK